MKISRSLLASAGLLTLSCVLALAQQITGVPGSPGATTTIDGKQLPPAPPQFGGVIKMSLRCDTLVAPSCRTTEGRAQRLAYYDG